MQRAHIYVNFAGNSEEAFEFYRQVFGGDYMGVFRYRDMGGEQMGLSGSDLDKIMHIALPLPDGTLLMATDVLESTGQKLTQGNNFYIYVETDSADEARRLFDGLSNGGAVEMDLARTEWAEQYGSLRDRFGVQWMVSYTGNVQFGAQPAA
ncbi:MAG TPA: VOC family protein [Longimicrobiaceae bacterium]